MSPQNRREFVKFAGAAVGTGAVLATSGSMTVASTQSALPPLRGPYADEPWVEYGAVPGNATATDAEPSFDDPDALEVTTLHDGEYVSDQAAVVGDTMYITASGRVRALDAHDGSVRWSSDDLGVGGTPAAAYGRVIATGGDDAPLVALDVEDGSVDWERDLDGLTKVPAVAYETVFTVSGDTLYALDVTDGSTRWERSPEAEGATYGGVPAASAGQVYAMVEPEEGDDAIVAYDAATGERLWEDAWNYQFGPAATEDHVGGTDGLGRERFRLVDAASGETAAEGSARTIPSLDEEAVVTILDWEVRATFLDDRDGWTLNNFSTSALSQPTIAGDTVFVYVGQDHREEYSFSLLAIDKYDGEVRWTVDVPASQEGLGTSVVATGDAVYVFDQQEIHVVQAPDATDGDGSTPDDSTPDDSTPDDSTPDDTPTETTDECGCPNETTSSGDGSAPGTGTSTAEDPPSGTSSGSTEQDAQPVENGTASPPGATDETDGAGPGLGVVSAVSGLGGIAYLLRRRLGEAESETDADR